MRKNVLLLVVSLALVFTGCNKTKTDIDTSTDRTFEMNNDLASLSERFMVVNEPIEWTNYIYKSSQLNPVSFNEDWRLLPYISGTDTLSASCVDALSGFVYVGSHLNNYKVTPAEAWGGEIAIVDLSGPSLVGSAYDPLVDYNDMEISSSDPNNLWITGENDKRGSVILRVDVSALPPFVSAGPTLEMSIFGTSGNSITVAGSDLWVSSATHPTAPTIGGGLLAINKNFPAQTNYSFAVAQAKQFDADGTHGVLLYGNSPTQSYIRVFDMNNLYSFVDYPLSGYDVTDLGKNAVDVSQGYVYLAMGDDGVIKVDLATGNVTHQFLNYGKGNANGVKVDGTYVYVAYGQGGFYLLDKTDLSAVGHWDTVYSCNYVAIDPVELPATSNHVYLANGRAGLICLSRI
ncbi:MAG: hypothetical protein DRI74_03350 [Bacteroidetes bacterium]|nr:MAG: hypothetical protein DRI74_03350 [Bacteroidota bacterium]